MTVHRYSVLDQDGVKINTIALDADVLKTDWYPGYGAFLIDEGEVVLEPVPELPKPRPDTWAVLPFTPAVPLRNGDKIDVKTGVVTLVVDDVLVDSDPGPLPVVKP